MKVRISTLRGFIIIHFFIGIAIITYWIGIEGFSRRNDPELSVTPAPNPGEMARWKAICDQLELAMVSQQLYKNQTLSVNQIAEELQIKPYLISKSLSEVHNKRFTDFVNEYRVKEVQELLKDPNNSKFTLLSIAMEAGFNSKSSFNRAVKKQLGILPSDLKPQIVGVNSRIAPFTTPFTRVNLLVETIACIRLHRFVLHSKIYANESS